MQQSRDVKHISNVVLKKPKKEPTRVKDLQVDPSDFNITSFNLSTSLAKYWLKVLNRILATSTSIDELNVQLKKLGYETMSIDKDTLLNDLNILFQIKQYSKSIRLLKFGKEQYDQLMANYIDKRTAPKGRKTETERIIDLFEKLSGKNK